MLMKQKQKHKIDRKLKGTMCGLSVNLENEARPPDPEKREKMHPMHGPVCVKRRKKKKQHMHTDSQYVITP